MDISERILRAWMPAIHAGMTKLSIFMFCGEREITESFARGCFSTGKPRR
jgi:hypothetical protein